MGTRRRDFVRGAAAISQKRLTLWLPGTAADFTLTAAGGTIAFSLNAAALALRPFTIVRTHMQLFLRSDQAAAIEQQRAAVGMAIVSEQASAIGVTAVPTPVTDDGSDLWYLHQWMYADESNLTDRTRGGSQFTVDSKAMRKVNNDQDCLTVLELSSATGCIVTVATRSLVKLH